MFITDRLSEQARYPIRSSHVLAIRGIESDIKNGARLRTRPISAEDFRRRAGFVDGILSFVPIHNQVATEQFNFNFSLGST